MFIAPFLIAIVNAQADIEFRKRLMAAPAEDRARMQKDRDDMLEKARVEAIAERRHRETVEAIRSLKRYE